MLLALRADGAATAGAAAPAGNGHPAAPAVTLRTQVRLPAGSRPRGLERGAAVPAGTVPRVARLLALALHFDRLLVILNAFRSISAATA